MKTLRHIRLILLSLLVFSSLSSILNASSSSPVKLSYFSQNLPSNHLDKQAPWAVNLEISARSLNADYAPEPHTSTYSELENIFEHQNPNQESLSIAALNKTAFNFKTNRQQTPNYWPKLNERIQFETHTYSFEPSKPLVSFRPWYMQKHIKTTSRVSGWKDSNTQFSLVSPSH